MPHNDLAFFEQLQLGGKLVDKTGTVWARTKFWAEAIARLWLTPQPRVIATEDGGTSFIIAGGPGLSIADAPGDVRQEVYRYVEDAQRPGVPPGRMWLTASPTVGYEKEIFDCSFVSAHKSYRLFQGPSVVMYVLTEGNRIAELSAMDAGDKYSVWRVQVVNQSTDKTKGNVPTDSYNVATAGRIETRMWPIAASAANAQSLMFHKCTGETYLRDILHDEWNAHAYGWAMEQPGLGWYITTNKST